MGRTVKDIEVGTPEWVEGMRKRASEQEAARVYQLAFWRDDRRAMPADFIACALFSAVHGKNAPTLRGEKIASINNYTVHFTGRRLTQVHADVLMGIAQLARGKPEHALVKFKSRAFLRHVGRHTGKSQRDQLRQWLDDIIATAVRITTPDGEASYSGSLLNRAVDASDGEDATFAVQIPRDLCKAFDRGFAHIKWEQRKALMNHPLALWLHLYVTKFHKPVGVRELKRLSGSGQSAVKRFRQRLRVALDLLVEQRILEAWHIVPENDVLYYAHPGKRLPAGRSTQTKTLRTPTKLQSALPFRQEPPLTPRAQAAFERLHPGRDFAACTQAWRGWVAQKRIAVANPDAHFLKFSESWVNGAGSA